LMFWILLVISKIPFIYPKSQYLHIAIPMKIWQFKQKLLKIYKKFGLVKKVLKQLFIGILLTDIPREVV